MSDNEFRFTKFIYRSVNDKKMTSLVLPTVQSINIPDTSTIPSKPTIAGEYRNQYVATAPIRATLTVWLEGELYIDDVMDVSAVLNALYELKNNRIRFSISTSHTEEESRFLHDMVIESISTNRDASRNKRLVVTINCTQVKFVNLTWKMASAVEIFGREIFISQDNQTRKFDFVPRYNDADFSLNSDQGFWGSLATGLGSTFSDGAIFSGYKDAPVNWQVKNAIAGTIPINSGGLYYRLEKFIDFSDGNKTYNCNCTVQSKYGGASEAYNIDIGQFTVVVKQDDGNLIPNFPTSYVLGDYNSPAAQGSEVTVETLSENGAIKSAQKFRGLFATSPYIYDFADTYSPYGKFSITKTFDRVEKWDTLADYITDPSTGISPDPSTITNNIIIKDGYVYTRKIKDRYDFSVGYPGVIRNFVPDGGLKIDTFELTTSQHGFKPKVSDETRQNDIDKLSTPPGGVPEYKLYVVVITLGALLQIYLFCPQLFNGNILTNVVVQDA